MRAFRVFLLALVMAESVSAQIVLTPQASGYCMKNSYFWYSVAHPGETGSSFRTDAFTHAVLEGRDWTEYMDLGSWFWTYRSFNGVLEFDLANSMGGDPFPPPWMTSAGWTAQLEGLEVIDAHNTPAVDEPPGVDLFDMADVSQDGAVSTADFNTRSHIARLTDDPPPAGSTFTVDVTEALRHDLFGPDRYQTSGFVLKPAGDGKKVESRMYWSENARITVNFSSATPTPANPCTKLGVKIRMPSTYYSRGDRCECHLVICNPGGVTYTDVPLFVVLDVFGVYFFWPEFNEFDYSVLETVPPGPTIVQVLPEFTWPETSGTVLEGVRWIAGMTDPDMTDLLGDFDVREFGWGP